MWRLFQPEIIDEILQTHVIDSPWMRIHARSKAEFDPNEPSLVPYLILCRVLTSHAVSFVSCKRPTASGLPCPVATCTWSGMLARRSIGLNTDSDVTRSINLDLCAQATSDSSKLPWSAE